MRSYFPMVMAVASRNTDAYVGKNWYPLFAPENTTLGLSMVRPYTFDGAPQGGLLTADFAGYATLSWDTFSTSTTYNNYLRKKVVKELGMNPQWTRGLQYSGNDYVYTMDTDSAQAYMLNRATFVMTTWGVSNNLYSIAGPNPPIGMFIHENLIGNADPRVVMLTNTNSIYSNTYPSGGATWTAASGYYAGFPMYAAAYGTTVKVVTAIGDTGRVRYSTDGTTWNGTVVTGTYATSNFRTLVWSKDQTVCLAVGDSMAVASSSDGINFASVAATWSTTLVGRPAVLIAGTGPQDFILVTASGEIATSVGGSSWTVTSNRFVVDTYYNNSINNTPMAAWIMEDMITPATVFISAYGGQVFRLPYTSLTSTTPIQEVSDAFSQYTSQFSTADINGFWTKTPYTPSGGYPVAIATGGMGRLAYVYDTGFPNPTADMNLFTTLRSAGYANIVSTSVCQGGSGDIAVGFSTGMVAYRPPGSSTWFTSSVPGTASPIISIVHRPASNDFLVLALNGTLGYGTYTGIGPLSWSTSTELTAYTPFATFGNLARSFGGVGYMACSTLFDSNMMYSVSGDVGTWGPPTSRVVPPVIGPATMNATRVAYSPTGAFGGSQDYWFAYGTPLNSFTPSAVWVSPISNPTIWNTSSTQMPRYVTGMFSFGSNPQITMAIGANGTGVITTNISGYNAWGSSPGVTAAQYAFTPPADYYLPPTTITQTAPTTTVTGGARDVAFAVGAKARMWVSSNPSFF